MVKSIRQTTLDTLDLGTVLEIFKEGRLPAKAEDMVSEVFGPEGQRGSMVISGAGGIVGAGKTMQLGSRLLDYGVPLVALDLAGAPDGLERQYKGLVRAFGRKKAAQIRQNIIQLAYDGKTLPPLLKNLEPRFLLEAIPEVLDLKKAHYEVFRKEFPDIAIRSVTSGFPSSELGVGIAHPAFPHEINKVWEVVEEETSSITHLLWTLGLMPIPVSDHWSFVLDVIFCGVTLAGLRYHRQTNMPFWKIDKFIRKYIGPNPFRAHDAIGAKGANFLTWSCLHHLAKEYGQLFEPAPELTERKETGQNWYPPNHFRPLVDWPLDKVEREEFQDWILAPLAQMVSLMIRENRSHLSHMNAISELCAQFQPGILAQLRKMGPEEIRGRVKTYHDYYPGAKSCWHPESFENMDRAEWQHLYVNGEHDGEVGVITISRESYNRDVDQELNRTMDWLLADGIKKVIVTGDFHLSTQMVGADTKEFFPALEDEREGIALCMDWSKTARRLHTDFDRSVGFVDGKRCLGGMLELLLHCHYLVAHEGAKLGFPEVTIPVVPGMEGCHWTFRKAGEEHWDRLFQLLLTGKPVPAEEAEKWLIDYAGSMEEALSMAWKLASREEAPLSRRPLNQSEMKMPENVDQITSAPDDATYTARKAIFDCIQASCESTLSEALSVQSRYSASFMTSKACKKGSLGKMHKKIAKV